MSVPGPSGVRAPGERVDVPPSTGVLPAFVHVALGFTFGLLVFSQASRAVQAISLAVMLVELGVGVAYYARSAALRAVVFARAGLLALGAIALVAGVAASGGLPGKAAVAAVFPLLFGGADLLFLLAPGWRWLWAPLVFLLGLSVRFGLQMS
jgi:hypothetical protein